MRSRQIRGALAAVLLVGAALRIWQYAANTSLWLDEIMISRTIVGMPLWTLLTGSLPYTQLAPKGFLLVQKIAVSALGPGDLVLRLFPLICSLVALFVFWHVAARALTGAGPFVALAMFAAAVPLIYFSSSAKQYSVDVLVAVLLMWLAIDFTLQTRSPRRGWVAGVAGAVLVWFSLPAVFMVAGLGAAVALLSKPLQRGGTARLRALAPSLILWGLSAVAATLAAKAAMTPEVGEYMKAKGVWSEGFPPETLSGFAETFWPLDRLKLLVGESGGQASLCYPFPWLYVAFIASGFVILWNRNRQSAILLTGPLFVTLAAAVARQYPFSDRLIFYLVPGFLIAIAAFVEWIRQRASSIAPTLGPVSVLLLVTPTLYPVAAIPPPYRVEDMKPVLSYVEARRRPDDAVYVYFGALQSVTFYGPQYGLEDDAYLIGRNHRGNSRCHLEDLDTFRSSPRLWVLITHARDEFRARDDILGYLDAIGVRRDSFSVESRAVGRSPSPAEAFLYDLSDDRRAEAATATSFALTGPSPDPPVECFMGAKRMISGVDVRRRFRQFVEGKRISH